MQSAPFLLLLLVASIVLGAPAPSGIVDDSFGAARGISSGATRAVSGAVRNIPLVGGLGSGLIDTMGGLFNGALGAANGLANGATGLVRGVAGGR